MKDSYDILLCLIYHTNPFNVVDIGRELNISPEEIGFILRQYKDDSDIIIHRERAYKEKEYLEKIVGEILGEDKDKVMKYIKI